MTSTTGASLKRLLTKMPIAHKLALVFTLLIGSSMLLLGSFISHNQAQLIEEQYSNYGHTIAKQMAESTKVPLISRDTLSLEMLARNLINGQSIQGAAIYTELGSPLVQTGVTPPRHLFMNHMDHPYLEWQLTAGTETGGQYTSFISKVTYKEHTIGYCLVTINQSQVQKIQNSNLNAMIGTALLLLFFGILISFYLGRRITQPITNMALASDSINRETLGMVDENKQTDEVGRLVASLNNMREGMRQKMVLEESFSRYVSPTLAKAVIHDPAWHQLGGRYVNATVVFADIVGFTRLSENVQPEQLSALLNDYFGYISKAAHYFSGHVDKYIGDCAMLVFGSPEIDAKHQYHAIACAVIIQQLIEAINKQRQRQGQITVKFHIGINSGKMLAGNMGSAERMNYTVIGDAVNLAARLTSVAESGQIIISRELNSEILDAGYHITTIPHGVLNLRGKQHPVDTYRVLDIDNIRSQSSEILGQIIETDVI